MEKEVKKLNCKKQSGEACPQIHRERVGERKREKTAHKVQLMRVYERRGPPEIDPSDPSRPPPYNPDYETASPQPNVGWNRDLLEQTGDMDNDSTASRPIGFEALNNSNPDSSSVVSMGTELRHRRNEAQHEPETTEEGEVEVGRRERGREVREGRVVR
ncbi:hypothetical protein GBAR_LOCUS1460 [Geodia barretti]|uniref:Uncharacterized protein n=1 Tax=Geodia barretti TaxID=519541 RepID=A0AA35W549_GEOBA|nr:hypothetical protein GBAR_LOCUS1460 [Geodia barretti]